MNGWYSWISADAIKSMALTVWATQSPWLCSGNVLTARPKRPRCLQHVRSSTPPPSISLNSLHTHTGPWYPWQYCVALVFPWWGWECRGGPQCVCAFAVARALPPSYTPVFLNVCVWWRSKAAGAFVVVQQGWSQGTTRLRHGGPFRQESHSSTQPKIFSVLDLIISTQWSLTWLLWTYICVADKVQTEWKWLL